MKTKHSENHRIDRISWLRAAVLGANDGIISTASLLIGVAAANTPFHGILIAGMAGLIAGALSMAAGEYISVSSQADTEKSALLCEKSELENNPEHELDELASIYVNRGVEPDLALEVSRQLMAKDALAAHARDELGITEISTARPLQAAVFSAGSFTLGAILPLFVFFTTSSQFLIPSISIMSIIFLALLGGVAAKVGGAKVLLGSLRVVVWGSVAMIVSAGIGAFLGVVV